MKKPKLSKIILVLGTLLVFTAGAQITNRIFTLGNSVTDGINFAGFQAIANQKGNDHQLGRHMIPGTPLFLLYNSTAGGFNQSPYGFWPTAFANYDWDCISFQPFDRDITGSEGDFTTIEKWINYIKTNRGTSNQLQTYIYSRYPRVPQGKTYLTATKADWDNLWLGTYGAGGQTNEEKSYFIRLLNTVRGANLLSKPANLIPAGDVMYALNNKMALGRLGSFSDIWDFYADGIHVNNYGSFVLGATFFATTYKQDPRGITVPSQYAPIPDAIRDTILQTVYEVVFNHPFSGTSLQDIVAPTGITVSPKNNTLSFLQSYVLTAQIAPSNASNKNVSWSSNNIAVAQVDAKGKVTGVGQGVATLTGTTNIGGFKDVAFVTVSGLANFTSVTGVLVAWDFNGRTLAATYKATTILPNINTAIGLNAIIGNGLNPSSFDQNGFNGSNQGSRDLISALGGNEYIGFSLAPVSGKLLNINSISFTASSQNRTRTMAIFSSLNGFTVGNAIYTSTFVGGSVQNITIPNHTNIAQEVEFRMYIYYEGPDPFDSSFESAGIAPRSGNDLVVNGDIISPVDNQKPSSVTGILVSNIKDNGFFLSWNESTDNMIVTGYNVYLNGVKLNSTLLQTTSFNVTSLTAGTVCNLSVTAVDFVGNESEASAIQTITNRQPTAVITIDRTIGAAPLTINVNASLSTDPDGSTGDFVLGYDWNFGINSQIANSNSVAYTYTAAGVYTLSLVVVDTRNFRSTTVTRIINVTTTGSDITPPTAPASVMVLNNQSNQATIAWGSSIDNVSVLGYNIYVNGVLNNQSPVLSTQYVITGLTEGATYNVTVTAIDASANESIGSGITFITNRKPFAAFSGGLSGTAPFNISLNPSSSSDPDMGDYITDYFWTIGGVNYSGSPLNLSLLNVGTFTGHLQVKAQNGNLSTVVSFIVSVLPVPVTSISLSLATISFPALQSRQLSSTIFPANATNKNVTWVSSNPSVVTVDQTGRLTGQSVGFAVVTVTSQDGNFMAASLVTITGALGTTLTNGTLAGWDFAGYVNGGGMRTTTAGLYLTGISTVAPSLVLTIAGGLSSNGNRPDALGSGDQTATTLATSISTNEYFSFTVAPQTGSQMSITQVRFAPNSQSSTRTFVLMSSLNGFADGNEIGSVSTNYWCCTNGTFAGFNITGHNNLTSAVEFRVYVFTPTPGTPSQWEAIHIGPGAGPDFLIIGSTATPNDTQNPTAPGAITATGIRNTALNITWGESTDDIAVVGYNIYRNGIKLNALPVNALVYTVSGLTVGTSYPITVTSVDVVGKESIATTATISTNRLPVAMITGLTSGIMPYTITLSGLTSTDPDAGDAIALYSWNVGNGSPILNSSLIYTFPNSGIFPVVLQVTDTRGGMSTVATVNVNISAGADVTPPTAPSNLIVSNVTATSFTVGWTASTDNVAVVGYAISVNGVSVVASQVGTSYNATGLVANTSYTVSVQALDAAGNRSVVATVSTTTSAIPTDLTPPTAPSNLIVSNVTTTSFTIGWSASTDNVAVVGYAISVNGVSVVSSQVDAIYNVTGLTAGTNYVVSIQSLDAAGNKSPIVNVTTTTSLVLSLKSSTANKASEVFVYPNPISTDELFFSIASDGVVYDLIGNSILTFKNLKSINISDFNKGLYFVKFNSGKTIKLIRN